MATSRVVSATFNVE